MAGPDEGHDVEMREETEEPTALWRARIWDWYRNLFGKTYFLSPVYMNKTRHTKETLASGREVLVTERPLEDRPKGFKGWVLTESDVRDDVTVQSILTSLRQVSNNEVMFVVSQLRYRDYLRRAAEEGVQLPRPADLKAQNQHQGDFDVLVIHRQHGILVGEIKAVGDIKIEDEAEKARIVKGRLKRAIEQLEKANDVLRHITSDLQSSAQVPRVLKTLMLPNISRAYLQQLLQSDGELQQALRNSLCVAENADPANFCLTTDDIEIPTQWWQQRMKNAGTDSAMTNDVYLELVSRFAGPATTVSVPCSSEPRLAETQRTNVRLPGEGVAEAGNRFAPVHIVLHPSQVQILNDADLRLVYLTGPPGTGKSLVLVLKGQEWLRRGKPVHIVSVRKDSRSASYLIVHQLRTAEPNCSHLVNLHVFNMPINWAQEAQILAAAATTNESGEKELFIIVDEAWDCFAKVQPFQGFCQELQRKVKNLHLWSAALYNSCRPPLLTEVKLTEALRTPPTLTRLVADHRGFLGKYVYQYTEVPSPAPSDGHPVQYLEHAGGEHATEKDTPDCEECGREIARYLRHLHVGEQVMGRGDDAPTPLRCSDVFILTYGNLIRETSALIRSLRNEGYPVRVLQKGDDKGIQEVATMSGPDQITAADSVLVNGLERKIVIFVQHDKKSGDWGKLWAMSRCTSQLVWLKRRQAQGGCSGQGGRVTGGGNPSASSGAERMEH